MRRWIPAALTITLSWSSSAPAQKAPTILEANQKARALIAAAIEAHGGLAALREASQMRVTQEGYDFHRTQGLRVAPPWDSTVRKADVMIDLAKGQIVSENLRGYPGGFYYSTRFVTNGDKHYNVSTRNRNYSVQQYPPAREQFGNLFSLPQWYLLAAHQTPSPGMVRYLGRLRLAHSNEEVEAVAYSLPPSGNVVIGIDPRTHLLRANMSPATDVFTGDTEAVLEFLDWHTMNGVLMPRRTVQRRGGVVTGEMRYTSVTRGFVIPDSLLSPPASFAVAPPNPPASPVTELAPGVWAVGTGSRSLAVAFSDHLVVVDAPTGGSADVIARASAFAPGKPIRYIVPTHHHDDHFTGVRHYSGAGATIVTTPGNTDYLRRIMAAPISSVAPAAGQAPPSGAYRVETMDGDRRVFTDGTRTLEIHRIASPHAAEMLVAWLPAEGILFQADLIEAPQAGVALRGANAEATMHLAQVIREKGWNVRVFAGAHASLQSPAAFAELVAFPVIPPEDD